MKVYVAILDGVYRHEILGAYDDEHLAATIGIEFVTLEDDHYHTVVIVELELNNSAIVTLYPNSTCIKGKDSAENIVGTVNWNKDTKRAEYNKE